MIFGKDTTEDRNNIEQYIKFYIKSHLKDGFGVTSAKIDYNKLDFVLEKMRDKFPHCDGIEKANPFKKAANFVSWFMAIQPIENHFLTGGDHNLYQLNVNAILALEIAVVSLNGAVLHGEKEIVLNEIYLSSHSYFDIIDAIERNCIPKLNNDSPLPINQKILSVLFEQIVYKTNDCQYTNKEPTKTDLEKLRDSSFLCACGATIDGYMEDKCNSCGAAILG